MRSQNIGLEPAVAGLYGVVGTPGHRGGGVDPAGEAAVLLAQQPDPVVGVLVDDPDDLVGHPVVDDDQLPVTVGLREHRLDHLGQVRPRCRGLRKRMLSAGGDAESSTGTFAYSAPAAVRYRVSIHRSA